MPQAAVSSHRGLTLTLAGNQKARSRESVVPTKPVSISHPAPIVTYDEGKVKRKKPKISNNSAMTRLLRSRQQAVTLFEKQKCYKQNTSNNAALMPFVQFFCNTSRGTG